MAEPAKPTKTAAVAAAPAVAAPAVAAPAAAAPAPAKKDEPKLRAVQIRRISRERLKPIGHFSDPQEAMLPAGWDFADVLDPSFWSHIARDLQANVHASILHDRLGTKIDISTEDHAFFGQVKVVGLRRNKENVADGAYVVCVGPGWDHETGKCAPIDLKTGGIWKGRPAKVEAA